MAGAGFELHALEDSGEFGHIPIFENELICHCGKKGCLETEASGSALIRLFHEKIKHGSTTSLLKKHKNIIDITLTDIIQAAKMKTLYVLNFLQKWAKN